MSEEPKIINHEVEDEKSITMEEQFTSLLQKNDIHEVTLLLESCPLKDRIDLWNTIPSIETKREIIITFRGDARKNLIHTIETIEIEELISGMNAEQLIEMVDSLPESMIERALDAMDSQQRKHFEGAAQYSDDLIGHWTSHTTLILPQNAKVRDALRIIRRGLPKYTERFFVINRLGHYICSVPIDKIIVSPDHIPLSDLREEDTEALQASELATDAAFKVQTSGKVTLPVTDEKEFFLGQIDIGTASELVNEYYESQIMATAGMDENEDLFSPILKSVKGRTIWLAVNLFTAFLASWCIGFFEVTLEKVVALAVLMPIVASMGRIAGSQTLTLMIRGLALGQINKSNLFALGKKECSIGLINGVLWAAIIGGVTAFWFNNHLLGAIIAIAIIVNIIAAAGSGIIIPVLIDKWGYDPALSGAVILTTVTDIVGFVTFLGMGTLILL